MSETATLRISFAAPGVPEPAPVGDQVDAPAVVGAASSRRLLVIRCRR